VLALLASVLALATQPATAETAHAQQTAATLLDESTLREQARTLFERGVSLYRDEQYREALNYFIGAQNLFPNLTLTFNIARSCERLQDTPCALKYYREYRRNAQQANDLDEVDQHIRSLESQLSKLGIQQVTLFSDPSGAKITIDGADQGVTPWTGELSPGQHTVTLRQPGFADMPVNFLVEPAHAADWTFKLVPVSTAIPTAPVAERHGMTGAPQRARHEPKQTTKAPRATIRTWTWVALGSGVAALGTAGVLEALRASSERDARQRAIQLDRVSAYETMKHYQKAARIVAGAGLTLTTIGLTLVTLDLTRRGDERRTLSASCSANDCRLNFVGAW
jgi:tetratricopeptide (TPR) repeat protein